MYTTAVRTLSMWKTANFDVGVKDISHHGSIHWPGLARGHSRWNTINHSGLRQKEITTTAKSFHGRNDPDACKAVLVRQQSVAIAYRRRSRNGDRPGTINFNKSP